MMKESWEEFSHWMLVGKGEKKRQRRGGGEDSAFVVRWKKEEAGR